MNIIITAAGDSHRFKKKGFNKPKYLIKLGSTKIIDYVINMFDYQDTFHIIFQISHYKKYKEEIDLIKKNYKNINFYFVKSHNLGPVYSISLVDNLKKINGPILISYCDFFVEWDYKKFKKEIYGFDGAISTFKGFHASSFNKNLFAYLKVNKRNEVLEIREKKTFTKNKFNEPASTGIYYFKNFSIYNKYSKKLIKSNKKVSNEFYVSLVFNEMINDNLKVLNTEVDKFICLGTPEDYLKCNFWLKYFKSKKINTKTYNQINLIPLAGEGKRFKSKKYKVAKPFIPVENRPMFLTSCKSLPKPHKWIFLIQNNHLKKYSIKNDILKEFNSSIISVNTNTSGQLSTCYLARNYLKNNKSLFISSGDYKVLYSDIKLNKIISNNKIDGIIWTTRLKNILYDNAKNFAYCKINNDNEISQIIEKDTISKNPEDDPMVVGCFWYRDKNDFLEAAQYSFRKKNTINNEYYVGNSINYLIKIKKKKFVTFDVDYWISFGNPFELDIYHYWEELFLKRNNKIII